MWKTETRRHVRVERSGEISQVLQVLSGYGDHFDEVPGRVGRFFRLGENVHEIGSHLGVTGLRKSLPPGPEKFGGRSMRSTSRPDRVRWQSVARPFGAILWHHP